jgi:hypothetical protein
VTAAEVTMAAVRHAINLGEKTCSCRTWKVCGKPCTHALAVIAKISSEISMEDFVYLILVKIWIKCCRNFS